MKLKTTLLASPLVSGILASAFPEFPRHRFNRSASLPRRRVPTPTIAAERFNEVLKAKTAGAL